MRVNDEELKYYVLKNKYSNYFFISKGFLG